MGWPTDCSLPKCFVAFVRSVAPIKLYTVAVSCATTTQHFRAGSSSTSPKTTKPLCSPFTAKWRRRHKPVNEVEMVQSLEELDEQGGGRRFNIKYYATLL
uniref:Uncharacterized protein n=1 Tax=Globodera rostochiensis TaxID=31243 RepID=A0A914IAK4_GLORO